MFSEENVILRGIFHVVSRFPLRFMLYRDNLDCFFNSDLILQYINNTEYVSLRFTLYSILKLPAQKTGISYNQFSVNV